MAYCTLARLLLATSITAILSVTATPLLASPAQVKHSHRDLLDSYDYIIVGGGTSGLVIANRLSEDASKTVLVIELGYFADEPCIWIPKTSTSTAATACARHLFNGTTAPQPGLLNTTIRYIVGCTVGGSSAINGMFFNRGTKEDYDAWETLGNPGWGWDGLYEYFRKSTKFTAPDEESVRKFGYTWDTRAYGEGPIQASLPPWQWEGTKVMWDAWDDLNITGPKEHAFGNAVGRFWAATSEHPVNRTRSYARYGYYDPIQGRPNYHLLIGHKVQRLLLSPNLTAEGVIVSQRDHPEERFSATARKEVILAAGGVHTPQLLELSGIGPKAVLEASGVEVKLDLPGVGYNFQDHPQAKYVCNFTNDLWPNPATITQNATFAAAALAEYTANKTGPLTHALNNAVVFLPLVTVHSNHSAFVSRLALQSPSAYLDPSLPASVVQGYVAQKRILATQFLSLHSAVYESPFSGACNRTLLIQKPLSRGSIHINTSNPFDEPIIDFRVFSNPLDVEQAIEFIKFTRRYKASEGLKRLAPVETGPGPEVGDGDTEALERWVSEKSGPTSFHVCGTTAMMPRELGGVVSPDLNVYGTQRLRIVDAGVIPLIPGAHLSATVYAIAEKAADIIKS